MQSDVDEPAKAEALAVRLHKSLNSPYRIAARCIGSASEAVIALAPRDAKDAAGVFDKAGIGSVFHSRRFAAAQVLFGGSRSFTLDREGMARELRAAFKTGQLKIYYQPIIDIHKLEVAGFEALMRWHHPDHGLIPAANFISVAEETGQISELGAWAVETACRDAVQWPGPYRVSVNFSGQQFGCENPVPCVMHALEASGLEASRLEIEITEPRFSRMKETVHRQFPACRGLASRSHSTTSAPRTRHWRICATSTSTRSRSTALSWATCPTARRALPSSRRWLALQMRSISGLWPRVSRHGPAV